MRPVVSPHRTYRTYRTYTTYRSYEGVAIIKYERTLAQRVAYILLRELARLTGIVIFGLRCRRRDLIPESGGVLVCANHQSVLDPVLVGLACNRRMNYLARRTL